MGEDVPNPPASNDDLWEALKTHLNELKEARQERANALENLDAPRERKATSEIDGRLRTMRVVLERLDGRHPGNARVRDLLDAVKGPLRSPRLSLGDVESVIARLEELLAVSVSQLVSAETAQAPTAPLAQAAANQRQDDLSGSRGIIALEQTLREEVTAVVLEIRGGAGLDEAKKKFPDFEVWRRLSDQEQRELLMDENARPRTIARDLVKRQYGLISDESLKYHRRKLRRAPK